MKELIVGNLLYIGSAVCLLVIFFLANMSFSIYYNTKILKEMFNKYKLLNGIVKLIAFIIGLALLSIGITTLPILFNWWGLELSDEIITGLSVIAILSIFSTSIIKYAKEAIETLNNILNKTE